MGEKGLEQVVNPSALFLHERLENSPGAVIVPTVEGIRSILIEVQSLVTPSPFSTPTRKVSGLDANRLALLLAVLEKKVGFLLHQYDVFVSVAGGMRIKEPAIDLALLLSIASSFASQAMPANTLVVGEVGLSGEIRSVPRMEQRIREAIHMGFEKIILPFANLEGLSKSFFDKIELVGVRLVEEAIRQTIQ
jgi:DNA repair protein RadA/Sms